MAGMTERIANAVCCCMPLTERDLSFHKGIEVSDAIECWEAELPM